MYDLNHFVKFSAFILSAIDGSLDETEKKVLFNHPLIVDKIELDVEPLFEKYEKEITEKKEDIFFEQFRPLFKDVDDDFKYNFKTLLKDIMFADGVVDENELKIYNSISRILDFDENKYLDEVFERKELKELIIPSKYKVLKFKDNQVVNSLKNLYNIKKVKSKNPKIEIIEIGTKFEFSDWDQGLLEGNSHNLEFRIDYRKFKEEKYGTFFIVLTAINTDGGFYNLDSLKLKFGSRKQNITITKTSNHQKHHETSNIGSGDYKVKVTVFVESIQFSISPYEFKKIIELNNSLELKAETHTSNLDMSSDFKNSLICLFNETMSSNFKSFEIFKETEVFKSKLKKYNHEILDRSFKLIENDIISIGISNLNMVKVRDSFMDNLIWDAIKDDTEYVHLFDRFIGKKYLIMGIISSIISFVFTDYLGWWLIVVLSIIIITLILIDDHENMKKFKLYKLSHKNIFESFETILNNNKPKLLK